MTRPLFLFATTPAHAATYTYDAFGRRIQKNVDSTITNFIYDGDQVILETDAIGITQAKYIYGPGIDEPILMERGGETYYYHFDGLGSVTAITDSSGTTVESYTYDVYGAPNTTSSIDNPYLFTGRRYDAEAGLYYYRARYYSPTLGRFLQTDPIGYIADLNLYRYCLNNPIIYSDALGLDVIILNDPGGAYRQGHQAIAIGDDKSGWDYYSKDAYGPGNQRHIKYESQIDMYYDIDETGRYNTKGARYDRRYRIETSPDQDQRMREYADAHYNDPYSLPTNHCGDLVAETLEAGDVPTGEKPFRNQPNKQFENIIEANQPKEGIGKADRKKGRR